MTFDDILQVSQIGCWSWLHGRVEWDDMTRTLFVGEPSARDLAIYELVARAQAAAFDALKTAVTPGNTLAIGAGRC